MATEVCYTVSVCKGAGFRVQGVSGAQRLDVSAPRHVRRLSVGTTLCPYGWPTVGSYEARLGSPAGAEVCYTVPVG
jgi:hypothetical protein